MPIISFVKTRFFGVLLSFCTLLWTSGGGFHRSAELSAVIPADSSQTEAINRISEWAFAYNTFVTVNIPEGVTEISTGAFANNALCEIKLPDSLEKIDELAFANNNISTLVLPENLKLLGKNAFAGNNISDITIGEGVLLEEDSVSAGFYERYNIEQKSAGHYVYTNNSWKIIKN